MIHPDCAGKPQVLMMLERIFDHMLAHTGVRMVTMREMAEDFKRRHPFNGTTEGAPAAN